MGEISNLEKAAKAHFEYGAHPALPGYRILSKEDKTACKERMAAAVLAIEPDAAMVAAFGEGSNECFADSCKKNGGYVAQGEDIHRDAIKAGLRAVFRQIAEE